MIDWLLYLETKDHKLDGTKFELEQQCLYAPPFYKLAYDMPNNAREYREPIIIDYNKDEKPSTVIILDI